jgi:pyridoxamine 5'-phosphate oxidase
MQDDLSNYRKQYQKQELLEASVDSNPLQQFRIWFCEADENEGVDEPNAMTIATVGADGFPKNRVVLLKKYNEDGFIFYTNYESEKGKAITRHPKVCLSFFWSALERQVIIKGTAEKVAENDSENYFHSRPKGSQLGAVVSAQSEVISSREILEKELQQLEEKYKDVPEIPKPKNWGGFLVRPHSIEFWQGRPNRLHDRLRYTLTEDFDWKIERLAP